MTKDEAFNGGYESTMKELSLIDVNVELPELHDPHKDGGLHSKDVLAMDSNGRVLTMYLFSNRDYTTPIWCFEHEFVVYTINDIVAWRPL